MSQPVPPNPERAKSARSRENRLEKELEKVRRAQADMIASFQNLIGETNYILEQDVARKSDEIEALRHEVRDLRSELQSLQEFKLPGVVPARPYWGTGSTRTDHRLCFLLMPFSEGWSDPVWEAVRETLTHCGFQCKRGDEVSVDHVVDGIWKGICQARIVIADLTNLNPNVTYEVGLADVLGKDVVLLFQKGLDPRAVPFNFLGRRLITYEYSVPGVQKLSRDLTLRLSELIADKAESGG